MKLSLFLLAITTTAALASTEADFVRAGRRVSVHAIDSTLVPRRLDGREIHIAIGMGSGHLGIAGPPELWWATIDSTGTSRDFRSLGALARALRPQP